MTCALRMQFLGIMTFCFTLSAMDPGDNCQNSLLCAVSEDVLFNICEYLGQWRDINALGLTCKYLDRKVTDFGKSIFINFNEKRGDQSHKDFLLKVLDHLQHVCARRSKSPIELKLSCNDLADNMKVLRKFLKACVDQGIASHITAIHLAGNKLRSLPSISSFVNLKLLDLEWNQLDATAIQPIARLHALENLNLSYNKLTELPAEISGLDRLTDINLGSNQLSVDKLYPLFPLRNIQFMDISSNTLTYSQFVSILAHWPKLSKVFAGNLAELDLPIPLPAGVVICC